jgi:hypothetical protein
METLITKGAEMSDKATELALKGKTASTLREAVGVMNNFSRFMDGFLEADDYDLTDMLERLNTMRGGLAEGLRGSRSGMRADKDLAHIFPRAKSMRSFFKGNRVNIHAITGLIDSVFHQEGMHGNKGKYFPGGDFNKAWDQFRKNNAKLVNDPFYVIGFGFGLEAIS